MAKSKIASALARRRWAGLSAEERSAIMREVAKHPRPNRKKPAKMLA